MLLNKYQLIASECIFFDDNINNIIVAKELGINNSWISESIWPGVVIHSLWNSAIIGQVFAISESGNWNQAVYRYKLASKNDFLTGGTFGIEVAVPTIITYLGAILVIVYLRKRKRK